MAQVQLAKDWQQHSAGDTVEVDPSTLDTLKREGFVAASGDGSDTGTDGTKPGPGGDGWGGDT